MQNSDETEDGEISDDAVSDVVSLWLVFDVLIAYNNPLFACLVQIEPYTALERPTSFAPAHQSFKKIADDTDESSESSSSSDDSSSDEYQRPAKRQKKATAKVQKSAHPSEKRNVWSTVVFEDHIERELKDINVQHSKTYLDRSRDVESYNYSLCLKDRLETEDLDKATEKRIRKKLADLDKKDGSESFVKEEEEAVPEDFEQSLQQTQKLLNSRKRKMDQTDSQPRQKTVPKPRLLRVEDLSVSESSTVLEVAQDITLKLHEEKMDLILRVVEICGKELTIQLFRETQETENDGGIMIAVRLMDRISKFYIYQNLFFS